MLCVASTDPRMSHFADVDDVPEFDRLEIQHFFEVYKALEPGKEVVIGGWVGREESGGRDLACREREARVGDQNGRHDFLLAAGHLMGDTV